MRRTWLVIGIGAILGILFAASKAEAMSLNLFSSKPDFVKRLWSVFTRLTTLSPVQKTILTAQAVHEASWGVAKASQQGHNYWNLTAGSSWKGSTVPGTDLEYSADGKNVKTIVQAFRQYANDDIAIRDFLAFIGPGTRYAKAWAALMRGDAVTYVAELRAAGFFTQPLPLYQKAMQDAIKQVISIVGTAR